MAEGRLWRVNWKKTGPGFELWLARRPSVRIRAGTFERGADRMVREICDRFGDGEARLEFDPAEPVGGGMAALAESGWVRLSGEGLFYPLMPRGDVFEDGSCDGCGAGLGRRTRRSLRVCIDSGADLVSWWQGRPVLWLASGEFLGALTAGERRQLGPRPVSVLTRQKKAYFELRPRLAFGASGIKGVKADGWRCAACGHAAWLNSVGGAASFVDAICPARPIPERVAFVGVGLPSQLDIAVRAARWRHLRQKAFARGVRADPLVVVPSDRAVAAPKLRRAPGPPRKAGTWGRWYAYELERRRESPAAFVNGPSWVFGPAVR